jgi:hypothetical protein
MEAHMEKRDGSTKFLAIAGTVLVWLPLLAPVIFGVIRLIQSGRFLFDFLIPAELFPVELLGGILLILTAFRAKSQKKLIGWSFAAAIVLLVGSQGLAFITGVASGETEPRGLLFAFVLIPLVLFIFAQVIIGVGGILLIKDLSKPVIAKMEDPQLPQD